MNKKEKKEIEEKLNKKESFLMQESNKRIRKLINDPELTQPEKMALSYLFACQTYRRIFSVIMDYNATEDIERKKVCKDILLRELKDNMGYSKEKAEDLVSKIVK